VENQFPGNCYTHTNAIPGSFKIVRESNYAFLHQLRRAPRLLISWSHGFYINYAVRRGYSSPSRTGSTSTSSYAASTCLPAAAALPRLRRTTGGIGSPCRASGCHGTSRGSSWNTSPTPCVRVPRHVARLVTRLVALLIVDYFDYTTCLGASARRAARHAARHRLLRPRCASGCLDTSRRSSSTTPPRAGSSSTTSPPPRVRVPRLVTWLVAPLVVDYSASRRLVVNYFANVVLLGAATRCAARHAACRVARRRLLRLRRASGCLGTSCGSSRRSSSTSSTTPRVRVPRHVTRLVTQLVAPLVVDYSASRPLVVDYFASATRPGASAHRAARHAACRVARHRLLRLHRASGCLGTSRGSSRRSSSTSSTTPRVRVPRHVARLVTRLVAPLVVD
jgi:hypothetical protein